MPESLKLLAVFAHPDDESMGVGGTLIKYAAEGVETSLICATRGERGWRGAESDYPGATAFGKIREGELLACARLMNLGRVEFLDYIDGDLDQADPSEVIAKIVALIREIRPRVIVTFPHDGAYGHPDHIAISQFTTAACVAAANDEYLPLVRTPHRVDKLYYFVVSQALANAYHRIIGDISIDVDGLARSEVVWPDWAITTRIECAEHWETVWQAIRCHRSQTDEWDVSNFADDDLKAIVALQEFYRAYSLVNGGRLLETDLFAGIRDEGGA